MSETAYDVGCPECQSETGFPLDTREEADGIRAKFNTDHTCAKCGNDGPFYVVEVAV